MNTNEQGNPPNYVVCHCQWCGGHIEFDANQLTEENCVIQCPHCTQETKLVIPRPPSPSVCSTQAPVLLDHKLGPFPKGTKVSLTPPQVKSTEGQQLINLLTEIVRDGFITDEGVRRLHGWLETKSESDIRAIHYLLALSKIVLGNNTITMDNKYEMQLAIERVLPKQIRDPIKRMRYEIEPGLPASEKTLARIRELGGTPPPGMTRTEAFEMESDLSSPATENQIAYIRRLGGNPRSNISFKAASDLIGILLRSIPATDKQLEYIDALGGNSNPNLSRADAEELIPRLEAARYENLAKQQAPSPRQLMVLRFWNQMHLVQTSKWDVEKWLTHFYDEDSRRKKAWELFKAEIGDDGSQYDPSIVPVGIGHTYLEKVS